MPKLLIVATVVQTIEGFMLTYGRRLKADGWVVDVMANGVETSQNCLDVFHECFDIGWSRSPKSMLNFSDHKKRILSIALSGGYDLIHVHTPIAAFLLRFALRGAKSRPKIVYTAHGFHFYKSTRMVSNFLYSSFEAIASRWMEHLIVINQEDYDAAVSKLKIVPDNVTVMNGIGFDAKRFANSIDRHDVGKTVRMELGIPIDAFVVIMVAEFNPGKRHIDLINAYVRLGLPTNWYLIFVGDGLLFEKLKQKVNDDMSCDRILFLGRRSDIPRLLSSSNVMAMPSEREGLPVSVMESMAMCVPVVGSSARGVRDLIDDCGGFLFDVGDVDALAAQLKYVYQDDNIAKCVAEKAQISVQKYSFDAVYQCHLDLYANKFGLIGKPIVASSCGK